MPLIALDDFGAYVRWIFDNPSRSIGMNLEVATQHVHLNDMVEAFRQVTGQAAVGFPLPIDHFLAQMGPSHRKMAYSYSDSPSTTLPNTTSTSVTSNPATTTDAKDDKVNEGDHPNKNDKQTEKMDPPSKTDRVERNDKSLMTVHDNFRGFFTLWQHSGRNQGVIRRDYELLDEILPTRIKSVEEWMRKTEYTGLPKPVLKDWELMSR